MAPVTRSRQDTRRKKSTVFVLIPERKKIAKVHSNSRSGASTHKRGDSNSDNIEQENLPSKAQATLADTTRAIRATRHASGNKTGTTAQAEGDGQTPVRPNRPLESSLVESRRQENDPHPAEQPTFDDTDDDLRTPLEPPSALGLSNAHPLGPASALRSPPPTPKHRHVGKEPVSLGAALEASGTVTPEDGLGPADTGIPLVASVIERSLEDDDDAPSIRTGPPGVKGKWRAKTTNYPEPFPRDYPFAGDPSTHKSPPRRPKARRIGKRPSMPDLSSDSGPSGEPLTVQPLVPALVTAFDIPLERQEFTTPAKLHDKPTSPPPLPEPPSGSGQPLGVPPAFRRLETPTISPRPARPPHLHHRRQHLPPPESPLPPSSPPTEHSPAPSSDRIVEDVSFRATDRSSFWPTDEQMYADGDEDQQDADNDDKENDAPDMQRTPRARRSVAATHTPVVDVLGIGVAHTASRTFETPHRPRHGYAVPATSAKDLETAALFAPGMSDDSGTSNVIDYRDQALGADDYNAGGPGSGNLDGTGGSDKENVSADAGYGDDALPTPDDLLNPLRERGILQPHGGIFSSPRSRVEGDPFGILAAEARVQARRQHQRRAPSLPLPAAGPARRPFAERSFADLNPPTSPAAARIRDLPSSSPRYSHSSMEDLYATPPSQKGFGLVMSTPIRGPRRAENMHAPSDENIPVATDENAHVGSDTARTPVIARTPLAVRTPIADRTPMTPRNGERRSVTMRRHKLRGANASLSFIDPVDDDVDPREPSPSPVKRRRTRREENESEGEETETERKGKAKEREPPTKGKENAAKARTLRKRKKSQQEEGEEGEDPMEVTKRLEGLLPRRQKQKRPAAKRARKKLAENSDSEDDDEDDAPRVVKATAARKRGTYAGRRARGRRVSTGRRAKDESTPEEVREKRQRDRLERAEYFKKLEGYKLRKEKVYTV